MNYLNNCETIDDVIYLINTRKKAIALNIVVEYVVDSAKQWIKTTDSEQFEDLAHLHICELLRDGANFNYRSAMPLAFNAIKELKKEAEKTF